VRELRAGGKEVPGGVRLLNAFQLRYRNDWQYSVLCEASAYINLKQVLGLDNRGILRTGKGTMSTAVVYEPFESPPDFYIPSLNLFVEVTHSKLSMFESYSRCSRLRTEDGRPLPPAPHLFIRHGKYLEAREQRRERYPLVEGYEEGGEPYFAVPWNAAHWWKPAELRAWVLKEAGSCRRSS
jgi:hypothetical protein